MQVSKICTNNQASSIKTWSCVVIRVSNDKSLCLVLHGDFRAVLLILELGSFGDDALYAA